MDIHCLRCGEPWDTYHMRHDEVWEIVGDPALVDKIVDLPWNDFDEREDAVNEWIKTLWQAGKGLDLPGVREAFKGNGWEFGSSVLEIRRCPGCKDREALPDSEERMAMAECLAEVMGDDIDGMASMMEDFKL
jgi:hypothetical protein